jgi:hypothetical protein
MTHKFLLSVDTSQNSRFRELTKYLKEMGLVKSIENGTVSSSSSEGTLYAYVGDKNKFLAYLNKRSSKRDSDDPRDMIVSFRYEGKISYKPPVGKNMIRQALKRIRNKPKRTPWIHSL